MWPLKGLLAGLIVAALSLYVARDYLRPMPVERKPGLSLADAQPPLLPTRYSRIVGTVYLVAAALGFLFGLWSLGRL